MVGPSRTTMRRAGIRACGAHPRAPGSVIQKSWTTLRSPTNQFDRCQLRRTGQNFFLAFLFHDESFSHPCGLATRPTVREFEKEISKRKKKKRKEKGGPFRGRGSFRSMTSRLIRAQNRKSAELHIVSCSFAGEIPLRRRSSSRWFFILCPRINLSCVNTFLGGREF